MKEAFESVRKDFEEAARCYQNSRLEPLPAKERAIVEEWISILNQSGHCLHSHPMFMLNSAASNRGCEL
jgi:hypothetical protein